MERERPIPLPTRTTETAWRDYGAVPRDGPAAFIVRAASDDTGADGAWIDLRRSATQISRQIERHVTGQPGVLGGYAIVDQIAMGPEMLDEQLTPSELADEAWFQMTGVRP